VDYRLEAVEDDQYRGGVRVGNRLSSRMGRCLRASRRRLRGAKNATRRWSVMIWQDTAPENARIKMFALRTSRRWISTTSSPVPDLLELLHDLVDVNVLSVEQLVELCRRRLQRRDLGGQVSLGRDEESDSLTVSRDRDRSITGDVVRKAGSELTDTHPGRSSQRVLPCCVPLCTQMLPRSFSVRRQSSKPALPRSVTNLQRLDTARRCARNRRLHGISSAEMALARCSSPDPCPSGFRARMRASKSAGGGGFRE
jgi:hypothetical protein